MRFADAHVASRLTMRFTAAAPRGLEFVAISSAMSRAACRCWSASTRRSMMPRVSRLRLHLSGRKEQLFRARSADKPRKHHTGRAAWISTKLHLGPREYGRSRRNTYIAIERDFVSAAKTPALYGRDHWLWQIPNRIVGAPQRPGLLPFFICREVPPFLQIRSGRKRPFSRAW